MRAVLAFVLVYLSLALVWAFYTPVSAWLAVRAFGDPAADARASEDMLARAGPGATLSPSLAARG